MAVFSAESFVTFTLEVDAHVLARGAVLTRVRHARTHVQALGRVLGILIK